MAHGIWESFKSLLAYSFIIYFVLFFIVGGEVSLTLKWQNIGKFIESVTNYIKQ